MPKSLISDNDHGYLSVRADKKKEAEGTLQKQLPTPTMTKRF